MARRVYGVDYSPIREKTGKGAKECVDLKTIKLVMHASIILLKVLSYSLETFCSSFQPFSEDYIAMIELQIWCTNMINFHPVTFEITTSK